MFRIDNPESLNVSDVEIRNLLARVYVDSGFTAPERAVALFSPPGVRGRGHLICARSKDDTSLAGMVIVVFPGSKARCLAFPDETEMHLLAVSEACRGFGLGRTLVRAAISHACTLGYRKMALWTQPAMVAAQRLYESEGFRRASERDPVMDGARFLAYEKQW